MDVKKINSRSKGQVGEREWRDYLISHGINAQRGLCQSRGNDGTNSDVISDKINNYNIHWEVKRVEKLNIYNAMDQANKDKLNDSIPIVAHRKNKTKWLITLQANDFFNLIKEDKSEQTKTHNKNNG